MLDKKKTLINENAQSFYLVQFYNVAG